MDAHTLAVSNLLFLVLYAVATLIYRTMYRGIKQAARGCDWFVASNVILALPFLEQVCPAFFPYRQVTHSALFFALVGHLPLHRAFAALRGREQELWRSQLGVTAIGLGVWLAMVMGQPLRGGAAWLTLVFGLQYGLTGLMMFRPADGMGRAAGWFAGVSSVLYAFCHFAWFGMATLVPGWNVTEHVWSLIRLVTHVGLALGFLLMSVSRLHIQMHRETELDELTGLMNLRAIRRAAAAAIARCRTRGRAISVVMIDLDDFKEANDRLGHDAGDVLLCGVAKALKGRLREEDKVARLGGDEFCLLLPYTDEAEAVRVAERCRATLTEMVILYGGEWLHVTASFGVAFSDRAEADWEELLRSGDMAMYEAKRGGGNRIAVADQVNFRGVMSRGTPQPVLVMREPPTWSADQMEATGISMRS
jgi:diguanylate cyclase (GGDEF)-like protein